jgi:hypothetical protein
MQASRDCLTASTTSPRQLSFCLCQNRQPGRSKGFPGPRLRAAAAATLPEQQQHSVPQQPYPAAAHIKQKAPSLSRQQHKQQQQDLQRQQQQQQLPKHVAIIMDGNSRWAESKGLPAWVGHERGAAALRAAVIAAQEWGIPALTVRPEEAWLHACIHMCGTPVIACLLCLWGPTNVLSSHCCSPTC